MVEKCRKCLFERQEGTRFCASCGLDFEKKDASSSQEGLAQNQEKSCMQLSRPRLTRSQIPIGLNRIQRLIDQINNPKPINQKVYWARLPIGIVLALLVGYIASWLYYKGSSFSQGDTGIRLVFIITSQLVMFFCVGVEFIGRHIDAGILKQKNMSTLFLFYFGSLFAATFSNWLFEIIFIGFLLYTLLLGLIPMQCEGDSLFTRSKLFIHKLLKAIWHNKKVAGIVFLVIALPWVTPGLVFGFVYGGAYKCNLESLEHKSGGRFVIQGAAPRSQMILDINPFYVTREYKNLSFNSKQNLYGVFLGRYLWLGGFEKYSGGRQNMIRDFSEFELHSKENGQIVMETKEITRSANLPFVSLSIKSSPTLLVSDEIDLFGDFVNQTRPQKGGEIAFFWNCKKQ